MRGGGPGRAHQNRDEYHQDQNHDHAEYPSRDQPLPADESRQDRPVLLSAFGRNFEGWRGTPTEKKKSPIGFLIEVLAAAPNASLFFLLLTSFLLMLAYSSRT